MKLTCRTAACTLLMLVSASAFASSRLTPQQCNDYPFKPLNGPATHAQLMNELAELESVGYDPSAGDDDNYPNDIQQAEQRLQVKYHADCGAVAPLSTAQSTSQ